MGSTILAGRSSCQQRCATLEEIPELEVRLGEAAGQLTSSEDLQIDRGVGRGHPGERPVVDSKQCRVPIRATSIVKFAAHSGSESRAYLALIEPEKTDLSCSRSMATTKTVSS